MDGVCRDVPKKKRCRCIFEKGELSCDWCSRVAMMLVWCLDRSWTTYFLYGRNAPTFTNLSYILPFALHLCVGLCAIPGYFRYMGIEAVLKMTISASAALILQQLTEDNATLGFMSALYLSDSNLFL